MKRILIFLLTILLLTGCSSKNTLESILKEEDYSCLKNVCTKKVIVKSEETLTYTVDINNTTYEVTEGYSDYSSTSKALDYNWKTNEIKMISKVASIEFTLEGNRDDDNLNCTSTDEDETFVKAECSNLEDEIKDYLDDFDKILNKVNK